MDKYVYIARPDCELLHSKLNEWQIPCIVRSSEYDYAALKDAFALVPGKLQVTEKELEAAQSLRVIAKYGVGLDRIDLQACTAREILVCNTPMINYVSVAEHAIALLMTAAKQIIPYDAHLQQEPEKWRRQDIPRGIELQGRTVAVLGLGRIGQYVAMLAHGLGMHVKGYDPYLPKEAAPAYIERSETLNEAMRNVDFVSIHVAGTEQTRGMIGKEALSLMKPSAYLINTTRGFVVDEQALIEALDAKRIAGAALDVFSQEPLYAGHPLLGRENVVITPHIAANTTDAHIRAEAETAENIRRVIHGQRPESAVNGPFAEREKS